MKSRIVVLMIAVTTLLSSLVAAPASAQSSSSGSTQSSPTTANSLRIAPVRSELTLDPGTTKEVTVYAQNLSTTPVQVRALVSDFEANTDESGDPLVILDDSYAESHSLKRLATVEPALVTLPPNTRTPVQLKITVPTTARAGGYYGVVRFVPASSLEQDENGVAISANVGSLVLLKVNGDLEEKMTLASMDVRQNGTQGTFFTSNDKLSVRVRFENQGNVQLQPFGKLRIKDRSGKVVEEVEVNNASPRGNVLPESIRRFEVDLRKVGSFGKYTVEGNFGYGAGGEILTSKTSFWVVPVSYMFIGAGILLVLGVLIFLIVRVITLSRRGRGGHARRY